MANNDKTVRNPIVNCNGGCKKDFKLKPSKIQKEKVVDGIERSFFKCPHCGHKYIVCYEDQEFKDNISEMDKLRKQMSSLDVNNDEAKEVLAKYQKYHEKNITISQNYKKVYGR